MENLVIRDAGTEKVVSVRTDHLNHARSADSLSRQLTTVFESAFPLPKVSRKDLADRGPSPLEPPMDTLTLDFELVRWLSSRGLNELISINRLARNWGVRLVLSNMREPVREVFELTRLERTFELSEPHTQVD